MNQTTGDSGALGRIAVAHERAERDPRPRGRRRAPRAPRSSRSRSCPAAARRAAPGSSSSRDGSPGGRRPGCAARARQVVGREEQHAEPERRLVTARSPTSQPTSERFSTEISARQPSRVTVNDETPKTSAGFVGRVGLDPPERGRLRRRLDRRRAPRSTRLPSRSPRRGARRATKSAPSTGTRRMRGCSHNRVGRLAGQMDLYEYQGKELFRRVGIPVGEGRLATTPGEARQAAEVLGGPGRRQGPGAHRRARQGRRGQARRRPRTRPRSTRRTSSGSTSRATSSSASGSSRRPTSRRSTTSRSRSTAARRKPLFMFTTQGGVEIEQVADENPEALVRLHVDPLEGFHPWQARRLVYGAGVDGLRPSRSRSRRSSASCTTRSCASTPCCARSTR